MPNIPRRKIYEKMLEYEDVMLDMHVLLLSNENFDKFSRKFNLRIEELKQIYKYIKVLFVLFLENKKYDSEKEYLDEVDSLLLNKTKVDEYIFNNPNINKKNKVVIKELNNNLLDLKELKNIKEGKILFERLDNFNSHIPKLLEIRRDKMK